MKILIATGIYPPDIGGPSYYAKSLAEALTETGHTVKVLPYRLEKRLPTGIRHLWYFLRGLVAFWGSDAVIALDTFSVGLPAVLLAKLYRKKLVVRIGGDFLWEAYVDRTRKKVLLSEFYKAKRSFSQKEKFIFKATQFLLKHATAVVFSTEWQRDIFLDGYALDKSKTFIVENFYPKKRDGSVAEKMNFLWAGRDIFLKNVPLLQEAFRSAQTVNQDITLDIVTGVNREELLNRIQHCYAVVLPSLSEVSPNFILEAMMFNKPFIVTKGTGFYSILKDVGVFVDPLNKKDVEDKILMLADKENYQRYNEKVQTFTKEHTYKDIANEFISIIRKI